MLFVVTYYLESFLCRKTVIACPCW